ncbi:MAG: outer membrane beta-barrel protein [Ignavibacteriaceae bacterium]|nr:outer membrane beta-barrel protein [Ignavibacteriaceae bacterium]
MKKLLLFICFAIPLMEVNSQEIGEFAEPEESKVFPNNSLGFDIMFSEGGIGLGVFYRRQLSQKFTIFSDFSFSEAKDDQEFEYINPYYPYEVITYGKKNRIFVLPLNFGLQYRILKETLSDNLRPYLNFGVGPSMVVTTPYEREFFNAFGKAQSKFTLGGYVGFGANFGLDNSSLVGLNIRYYVIKVFGDGVESLYGKYKKELGGIFLTINIGMMY